jgi:hypothetical protein
MKIYGVSGAIIPAFLISALDGVEWSAQRSCRFTPGGKSPCYPAQEPVWTLCIREKFDSAGNGTPTLQSVAIPTSFTNGEN